MIRKISSLIVLISISFLGAVMYGNAVIYYGFPEIPNIFLRFFRHFSGEKAYDLIYCHAFFSFFLSFFSLYHIKKLWEKYKMGYAAGVEKADNVY